MKLKRKHWLLGEHLLHFAFWLPEEYKIIEAELIEFISYISFGGTAPDGNTFYEAQRWKEFQIESIIDEMWEWNRAGGGWWYPISHEIEFWTKAKDEIMTRALEKIRKEIQSESSFLKWYERYPKNKL